MIEMRRQNGVSGSTGSSSVGLRREERRDKPRIYVPFPTTVRGVGSGGKRFEANTQLENLGATGLYLRLDQPLETGKRIFVVVYLSTTCSQDAPRVAIRGIVQRVELKPDNTFGVAVAITHHRFL